MPRPCLMPFTVSPAYCDSANLKTWKLCCQRRSLMSKRPESMWKSSPVKMLRASLLTICLRFGCLILAILSSSPISPAQIFYNPTSLLCF
ncbi:hypothetical protein FGO68_gene1819 [Halteria grandinella]|uniref:Uncharacterized protein n=1 Tax=Halteria grandinella TaxID=5974 RepID=A0A8J8NHD0_HALGN|nr:hypothetical protein FGO68_gene1819 [Halteria grandinella]